MPKLSNTGLIALKTILTAAVLCFFVAGSSSAEVLFMAHYNDSTANGDYSIGSETASSPSGLLSSTTPSGKWGGGLNISNGSTCSYEGLNNLDPVKGTVDFWYANDASSTYQPLFGWYNLPGSQGTRDTAFECYFYGTALVLAIYDYPDYEEYYASGLGQDVGSGWHHLEITWDCTGGDGNSEYNVYKDGANVARATGQNSLNAAGGSIHIGSWDYGYGGYYLHGRIDELRITNQVEHTTDFTPPAAEYKTPGTIAAVSETYSQVTYNYEVLKDKLIDLREAIEITQWTIESGGANDVEASATAAIQQVGANIEAVNEQWRYASFVDGNIDENFLAQFTVTAAASDSQPDPSLAGGFWLLGLVPPSQLSIIPQSPTHYETISFSAPMKSRNFSSFITPQLRQFRTETFSNSLWAEIFMGGTPTITINSDNKTVELSYEPPTVVDDGGAVFDPVEGVQGSFGPLSVGTWIFFCDEPGSIFSIPIQVSYKYECSQVDVAPPGGDGKVDVLDLIAVTDAWLATPGDGNWNADCDIAPFGSPDGIVNMQDFSIIASRWMNCN